VRIEHASPGRIPVRSWSSIIAFTWGETCSRTASTNASGTGFTGSLSRAAHLPARSPATACSAWWMFAGTISFSTAQANSRRTLLACALTYVRHQPASTMVCRTAFRASAAPTARQAWRRRGGGRSRGPA
jgi:hypothetical protein